jgi:predicted transcriptional regulator
MDTGETEKIVKHKPLRKKQKAIAYNRAFTLRLTDEEFKHFKILAVERNMPLSMLMRQALVIYERKVHIDAEQEREQQEADARMIYVPPSNNF